MADVTTEDARPEPADSTVRTPRGPRAEHRQRMLAEITRTCRTLLDDGGPAAITVAAVADRLSLTAPALYRYVESRDGLVTLARRTISAELSQSLAATQEIAGPDPYDQLAALCHHLRRWALDKPNQYHVVFGYPVNGQSAQPDDGTQPRIAGLFMGLALRHWYGRGFRVPADDALATGLQDRLTVLRDRLAAQAQMLGLTGDPLPVAAVAELLQFWTRVYGLISMEVYGQLEYLATDGEIMLDYAINSIRPLDSP